VRLSTRLIKKPFTVGSKALRNNTPGRLVIEAQSNPAMAGPTRPTQMIILPINSNATIEDSGSGDGKVWTTGLQTLENAPGFRRLYWGRHVEERGKTQVHIGMFCTIQLFRSEERGKINAYVYLR
jgi:hypothetical protein